ncbi:MAG: xanthine dehydrogenase family protein subunit M [Deferrisomatales bacterium]|nr:xanthine dehydrogenase family protein subunit M [Deferrisomatales bacterium]
MSALRYLRPRVLGEALDALGQDGDTRVVAGGTDLLVASRHGKVTLGTLVDVTAIPELRVLREDGDGTLRIGAATTHAAVAESPLVHRRAPLLAQASSWVGSVQVRNLATLGGNTANASVAADTLPALAALRAHFAVSGPRGERRLSVGEFFQGPGQTVLAADEILVAILIPRQTPHGASFLKIGRRRAAAISRLSAAVMANPETGLARIAVGAVFPRPQRLLEAEEVVHRGFGDPQLEEAGRAVEEVVRQASGGRASMAYKLPVVRALVVRALREARDAFLAERGKGQQ